MKILLGIVLIVFFLFGGIIFFPWHVFNRQVDLAYDATNQTLNADNAIYNYEWFKQTHQDIIANQEKIDNARIARDNFELSAGDRSTWTFEDKNEHARLNSIVLGLQNHQSQVVANYNARASMANRNIFEDSILPNYIDALTFTLK